MNIREKIERIEVLEVECYERFKALKAEVQREQEFPKRGDKYHYIEATGRIDWFQWDESSFGLRAQDIGNIYKTYEEAQFAREKLKVEAELRKFSRPFKDKDNNYYIEIYLFDKTLSIDSSDCFQTQGTVYFESATIANEAIDTVGVERIKKYIFGVED